MTESGHQSSASPPKDRPSFCFECRYDLTGSTSQSCPECGGWFDPEDPRTFYNKRRPGRLALAMMTPAGWPSFTFGLALSLLALVSYSVPGAGYFILSLIFVMALFIAVIAYLCDLLFSVVVSFRMGRSWLFAVRSDGTRVWRRRQAKWLIPPVMVISVLVLVALEVPARVSFHLSRNALLAAISDPPRDPTYVGLLPVKRVIGPLEFDEGVPDVHLIILSEGGGIFNLLSFAYAPGHKDDWLELGNGEKGWRYQGDWFLLKQDTWDW